MMSRLPSFGLLAALLSTISTAFAAPPSTAPAARAPRKLALLVGVARYDLPYKTRRTLGWGALHTDIDTRNMATTLRQKWGFAPSDIEVVQDLKTTRGEQNMTGLPGATRAGIMAEFRRHLVQQARPGDVVVFLLSGHGQQVPDQPVGKPGHDEDDGLDESFVPYDYIGLSGRDNAASNLRDDDLQTLLRELTAKMKGPDGKVKGSITVIVDSCHSGTISRGELRAKGRGWDEAIDGPLPPHQETTRGDALAEGQSNPIASGLLNPDEAQANGYVLISACQSQESAYEAFNGAQSLGGELIYNLCQVLRTASPQAPPTYRDAFERVRLAIAAEQPRQTPAIEGEIDQLLFSGVIKPQAVYPRVENLQAGVVTIDAGTLHGVFPRSRYALYASDANPANPRTAPLATVTIDDNVELYRCHATLSASQMASLTAQQLRGAKAVLTAAAFGDQKLRVLLAGTGQLAEKLREPGIAASDDALQIESGPPPTFPITSDNAATGPAPAPKYDVQVALENSLSNIPPSTRYVVRRNDGTPIGAIEVNESAPAKLRALLLKAWRWRYISQLGSNINDGTTPWPDGQTPTSTRGGSPHIDLAPGFRFRLRIIPVETEEAIVDGVYKRQIKRDLPTPPLAGNALVLTEGDYFRIEVQNLGEVSTYITILDLQPDGSIAPVFPHPQSRIAVENLVESGATLRLPGAFKASAPFGTDVYKLIATPEKVDFSSLLFQAEALPPDVRGEKEQGAADFVAQSQGTIKILARLLLNASTGTRSIVAENTAAPTAWGTTAISVETRRATP